jgi:predicted small integral membrane protein
MELAGPATTVARVAGIALIALAIACWPGPPRLGMLAYSGAVTVCLAYLGLAGAASGVLLWPAVVLHLVLTVLLVRDTSDRGLILSRVQTYRSDPLESGHGPGT